MKGRKGLSRRGFLKATSLGAFAGSVAFPFVATSAKGQSVTTISYLTMLNPRDKGPRQEGTLALIKDFEAKNPTIKVDVQVIPWAQIDRQFIIEASAGKEADVARLSMGWLPKHVEAESILPMDEFVREWSAEQRKDWLFPWEATVFNGKKLALPLEHRVYLFYYRKDILDQAGLKVPTTWSQLCEASKALSSEKMMGFVVGLSKKDNASALYQWLIPTMWSMGGTLWDKQNRAAFNSDAGQRAFQFLVDLVNKYGMQKSAINMGSDDITVAMQASRIAMTTLGTHRVGTVRMGKGVGENLQTAPLPYPDGSKPAAYADGWLLCLGRNTKHPREAWKLIEHHTSPESQVLYARIAGEMPSRKSPFKDPYFQSAVGKEMNAWADYVARYSQAYVLPPKFLEMADLLAVAASRVILEGVPIKKALADAEAEYNKIAAA